MNAETCALCAPTPPTVWPDDDIALCNVHWSRWVVRYLNSDDPAPCSAHVISDGAA